ncbi:hypothetical protein DFH09DRAFT_1077114 [Mycena vulgaris]|nr:hypothetical protein DFH09DRAFT_1077114 [Mycena vulgaris]
MCEEHEHLPARADAATTKLRMVAMAVEKHISCEGTGGRSWVDVILGIRRSSRFAARVATHDSCWIPRYDGLQVPCRKENQTATVRLKHAVAVGQNDLEEQNVAFAKERRKYSARIQIPQPPVQLEGDIISDRDLLLALTLPALTKLHLPEYWDDPGILVKFLSQLPATMLRNLFVHRDYDSLIAAIPLIPTLSELAIERVPLGKINWILQSLCDLPGGFMPVLESVRLRLVTPDWTSARRVWTHEDSECDPEDNMILDDEALVDALSARWNGHGRLRVFSILWLEPDDFGGGIMDEEDVSLRLSADILERLADLVDDGMKISLGTAYGSWL